MMSTKSWEAFFDSLPPSPEWAPFWTSLFEGALSAISVWFIGRIDPRRIYYTAQLILSLSIHVSLFLVEAWGGYHDGWPWLSVTECLGRMVVVLMFLVTCYISYYEQGRACMLSDPFKKDPC